MKQLPQQQQASVAGGHAAGLHGVLGMNVPPMAAQAMLSAVTQLKLGGTQHAPDEVNGQGGPHGVPAPRKLPPWNRQLHWSSWKHRPLRQHAPCRQTGHGLGLHVPPGVQLRLGGTGQLAAVVYVHSPFASQHAPSGMHADPGAHVMPGLGVPPSRMHSFGSVGKQ